MLEKILEIVRSYLVLWYMFRVNLEPDWLWFFFKLENKNTNKYVISASKSLSLSNKIEIFSKSSKETNEASSCMQTEAMFTIYLQLSL